MIGRSLKRKPCGRICRVIDERSGFLKVHDIGFWTGWVSLETIAKKWHIYKVD